jgi:transcriptional regulator
MRSAGYNYKLPKVNQGALVYTVDVSITAHGEGTDVYVPSSRAALFGGQKENAPMRVGEEIIISNVKITLIESGDFGDVIKVESAK